MRPLEIERALEEWKLIEPPEVLVAVIDGVLFIFFFIFDNFVVLVRQGGQQITV